MISKRAIRIHKGVLTARDKRMGVLNELISAVRHLMCPSIVAHFAAGQIHQILCMGRALDQPYTGGS